MDNKDQLCARHSERHCRCKTVGRGLSLRYGDPPEPYSISHKGCCRVHLSLCLTVARRAHSQEFNLPSVLEAKRCRSESSRIQFLTETLPQLQVAVFPHCPCGLSPGREGKKVHLAPWIFDVSSITHYPISSAIPHRDLMSL